MKNAYTSMNLSNQKKKKKESATILQQESLECWTGYIDTIKTKGVNGRKGKIEKGHRKNLKIHHWF